MILSVQVLGQTVLRFKVSIAQILVCIALCGGVEVAVVLRREHTLVWPGSGLLTGNGVAFVLRAAGTRHGDWWSLHGIQYFVLACSVALASKYLIRPGGRHVFNPSNVGVVWTLLVIGPTNVFPQYLWWGPAGTPVMLAYAVILAGAVWVLRSVRMVPMAVSFLLPFGALVGVFAATGRSFVAVWHTAPIRGVSYWSDICLSPELLIFVFFMMSDPQTAPRSSLGRVVYGGATAVVAAGLLFFQPTEFGIKLAILSSLTATCALVPLIERFSRRPRSVPVVPPTTLGSRARKLAVSALRPAVAAVVIIAVAAPVDTAALARDRQLLNIERGLTTAKNPQ